MISEVILTVASTWIKALFLFLLFVPAVSGQYYYNDGGSSDYRNDWGQIPDFEDMSQDELVFQYVGPFLFIFVLMQFVLKKALAFTLDDQNDNMLDILAGEQEPSVDFEAAVMGLAISGMLVASPYWNLVRQAATGLTALSLAALFFVIIMMIYSAVN